MRSELSELRSQCCQALLLVVRNNLNQQNVVRRNAPQNVEEDRLADQGDLPFALKDGGALVAVHGLDQRLRA